MNINQIGSKYQPHLCPRCQSELATLFCMGCQQTTCAPESIKHLESNQGHHLIVPIAEIVKSACDRVDYISTQRALMRHAAAISVGKNSVVTKEDVVAALDEAGLLLSHVQHQFTEQVQKGHVQVCFETDENVRKIDSLLAHLSHLASANESVMDLLFRLNLQRRGNMKNIMRSSRAEWLSLESGFDSNWTFLHSRLSFEEQKQIRAVHLVSSQRCSILPKNLHLMPNGDLIVTSYASCGIRVRAFKTSPFRKISLKNFTLTASDYQSSSRHRQYCYAREQGVQNFLDLRFKYSSFRVIQESMCQQTVTVGDEDEFEELDSAEHMHFEETKGAMQVSLEEHIKTIYYRFDKQRFFKNQAQGKKSKVPYFSEQKFLLQNQIVIKDAIGRRIKYEGGQQDGKSKTVFLFAFENVTDKRSYIKFYRFSNSSFYLMFDRQQMFADPVKQLIEVDKNKGMIAILFEKSQSGFALARTDFVKCSFTVIQHFYQRAGIKVLKVVPLDFEQYVLVHGERQVQDSKDVTQSVLIRQNIYDQSDKEMIHYDLNIHQIVRHPLFDAENFPICIIQSYTYLLTFDVVTMKFGHFATLGNPPSTQNDFVQQANPSVGTHGTHAVAMDPSRQHCNDCPKRLLEQQQNQIIRFNLPAIELNTLVFEEEKPYFYLINETHVEKYSYQLNVHMASE